MGIIGFRKVTETMRSPVMQNGWWNFHIMHLHSCNLDIVKLFSFLF